MSTSNRNVPPSHDDPAIIPTDIDKEYYLFLLEFYARRASGDRLARLNRMFSVPTCVRFGFLDYVDEDDSMEVTPVNRLFETRPGDVATNDVETINAGISVLFAVDSDAMTDRAVNMILRITVRKRMPDGIKPDVLVGTGELDLSGQYAALRVEQLQCWRKDRMTSKVFDGRVPLIHDGDATGDLEVFARMSSFGRTIVTRFDAPVTRDPTTFVFGAGEEIDRGSIYRFRKADPRTIEDYEGEDPPGLVTCPVYPPDRYPCLPCGKLATVEERFERTWEKQDDRETRPAERRLKRVTSRGIIQSSRGPSKLCGKPVVLKVSGIFDNGDGVCAQRPTVTVADESAATKPDDPSDPDHDVFVLRIGKKGLVGVGEKSDIQLEMKTPKGPERRPPIRYETREMQTDVEEVPPKEKKKKKKRK